MAIILRNTKGLPLTHEELDGNFTDLNTRVGTLESTADSNNQTLTLTFPDATVQSTAYPGPQTSLTGDVTGSVFANDNTLLVDGVNGRLVGPLATENISHPSNDGLGLRLNSTDQSTLLVAKQSFSRTFNDGDIGCTFGKLTEPNRIVVAFEANNGLYFKGLLARLATLYELVEFGDPIDFEYDYSNIRMIIEPDTYAVPANVVGVTSGNPGVYNIEIDIDAEAALIALGSEEGEISTIELLYDYNNTMGFDIENNKYGIAVDHDDIDLRAGRDIDLYAVDDFRVRAGSGFNLSLYRDDDQSTDSGIDINLISNDNTQPEDQKTWTFQFDGGLRFPDGEVQTTAYPGPYDQDLNTTDSVEFLNITQQQTVGVNNSTTTISQDTTYTKFAKVDIIDDGFGGTNTITRNVLLEGSALRFDNDANTAAYISNNSNSGHMFVQAGNGAPVDGQRNGGDLYLWAGARASGATAGGNIIMNSNGGDILIGPLENTDQIRIGGAPGYAGESTTTFYGDVNFASGKNVTFTGATVDFNGATIDWTPIVSGAIQNNGLPVGTRFTQPVPSTSKGTSGNVQGAVTFDSDYIYYCTATYSEVSWANTATVDILGGNGTETGIAITLDVVPSIGWSISDGTTTSTINQVVPQGSWYVIFWDDTITFEVGDTVYYGATAAVQPDIWKRVAWSSDTW